ncbi:2-octaprenylphenol hydroxylase [Rhodoblastus acidophilus]|uniref:2-octaprenylphenol hydroxylase n=1 Tax=Rhodoblastus acidophilus TaxID=1074 RepID=A0A212RLJ8_RHOAC|nr:2-polyprenylphenol 6-hydroxylase [Rhodoblastus acidophilus]PPQ39103.1 2-polyprenylphenol 6-hydroxylase [Rhodoblastus acidophilus]RAI24188.1 2-polyprenylphenol 6-hydroxylase [Rhodoblastus acidophilus]SNB73352.1 2-octaprenylphenol hydroxylase [Rhodoblastus acidophilus]
MISSIGHVIRLARAGWILAREGVFSGVETAGLPLEMRVPLFLAGLIARRGGGLQRIAPAIARLGPSYVKLGQTLATRPDVVGVAVARELEALQDRMAPFPREVAVGVIEKAFSRPIGEIFAEFSEPVAAASVAQVHRAKIVADGKERWVAVKVLRPRIERRFRRDLGDMFFAARLVQKYSAEARRLKPVEVVETLARSMKMEMDFRLEAAAASEYSDNTQGDADFLVPAVDWNLSAREVLTLQWIDGTPLSDVEALRRSGVDLPGLGRTIIQSFLRHAVRDGFFHADMHQGNLFLTREGRLAAVDFGIMGRLGVKERRFLAEILYGFITRDYQRVAEVHFEAGYVPPSYRVADFAQAIRAVGEPIHSRRADEISMAKLLSLLFEITALFDMQTRTELVMLQKTMVVVEGVARSLDPQLDMWSTAEPVVRSWIEENLGPLAKISDAGQGIASMAHLVSQAPAILSRGARISEQLESWTAEGLTLAQPTVEALARANAARNRFWRYGFAFLLLLLVVHIWR